ncbi:PilZ domain-containing protein [Salinispira pacifica]|uniref:PilZ domain-containing protein n=1 Tax=Salinispira pacifica TaxID=1307761 RepID=V5WJ64_9SPIO|nr:PilZ domain-containing protein [Salinispira pacifica]AHC15670.1 hypothetical protein L21SP2_2313 [Salinispira pacifica]
MENRRKHTRSNISWPIFQREGENREQIGELLNISLNGLMMNINREADPRLNGHFDLFVCKPHLSESLLEIRGETVWSETSKDGRVWGLSLAEVDEASRKVLGKFIRDDEDLVVELELKR